VVIIVIDQAPPERARTEPGQKVLYNQKVNKPSHNKQPSKITNFAQSGKSLCRCWESHRKKLGIAKRRMIVSQAVPALASYNITGSTIMPAKFRINWQR
jgi:hypothetical protein